MPTVSNSLFNRKLLQQAMSRQLDLAQIENLPQKRAIVHNWRQAIESATLKNTGEVALHGDFLLDFFGQVLGYHRQIEYPAAWQLAHEQKTLLDATKSDDALGFFTPESQDIRVIIELKRFHTDLDAKQHRKDDQRSPVEQAFGYAHKAGGKCRWVIVSNYQEVRLYHASFSGKYEAFQIAELVKEAEFLRFYYLLACPYLLAPTGESPVEALYRQSAAAEQAITGQFYAQYTQARRDVFEHLKQQHPERDALALLTHTQQLLDRFIFICFCEDTGDLLPEKTFRKLIQRTQESLALDDQYGPHKIWAEVKAFFNALNEGRSSHRIPGFNGELFKPDAEFDALRIADPIFLKLAQLTEYDFQAELNVNILGHIFEQSITDLEALRAEIRGEPRDRKPGKRKKEGIFYTPEYITRYIVEQAVGGWLADRRRELGWEALPDVTPADEAWLVSTAKKKPRNARVEQQIAFWEAYLEALKQIAVLDPACGSGAFLTQAFDYLRQEGERVNRELNRLRPGEQLGLFSRKTWDKAILRNNLFGVDLNPESVEITKLALWLKTAKKDDQLTALKQNIKCGNSLIDDPAAAGPKAFDWNAEFPEIMQRGGFDVVIGNPPYSTSVGNEKDYLRQKYATAQYQLDAYILFMEQAVRLLHPTGIVGLITPNSWLKNLMMSECRLFLLKSLYFQKIILNQGGVFQDASVDTLIFIACKQKSQNSIDILKLSGTQFVFKHTVEQTNFLNNRQYVFDVEISPQMRSMFTKMLEHSYHLSDVCEITRGINPYDKYTGQSQEIIQSKAYHADYKKDATFVPEMRGKHVERYFYAWDEKDYISYGNWLAAPRDERFFHGERLILREILGEKNFVCTVIAEEMKIDRSLYIALPIETIQIHAKYLLALLASKLLAFYFRYTSNEFDALFPKIRLAEFKNLPIKSISVDDQKPFIEKVDKMLELNQQLYTDAQKFLRFLEASYHPKTLSTKLAAFYTLTFAEFMAELAKQKVVLSKKDEFAFLEVFEEQKAKLGGLKQTLAETDHALDQMVYRFYDVTPEEIAAVESSA